MARRTVAGGERFLGYAVRPRIVARYLGDLLRAAGVISLVPAIAALVLAEGLAAAAYASVAALLFGVGTLLRRIRAPGDVQRNEALVVAALAFVVTPIATAPAFVAAGLPWLDALFEAISGVTTTGLSTGRSLEGAPASFLFARAWLQWFGGLGIVVLSVAIVSGPRLLARRMEFAQTGDPDPALSTWRRARRLLRVYATMTAAGIALLAVLGARPLDAVTYVLAAVSTGGFAPHDASLRALGPAARVGVILVSTAGAVSLTLYARAWRDRGRSLLADPEFRALLVLGAVVTGLLAFGMAVRGGVAPGRALRDAPLLGFSAQTTTGFSNVDVGALDGFSKAVLVLAMVVGGSVGSTAGGVKLLRFLICLRLLRWSLRRVRLPDHALGEPHLGGERLDPPAIRNAVVVVALFLATIVLSWLAFLAYGYEPMDALLEVTSAVGTVGLSTGLTRPGLEGVLKGILCFDMLAGRLEIVALLVLLAPRTWFGRRAA